ncbi:hypothetical protein GGI02_005487 [Coemansia sp. RSA 2322]|nr:hypothetical protein GGI02_005487 [Coemansia sp. RSA 2322]
MGLLSEIDRQKDILQKLSLSTAEYRSVCAQSNPYEALQHCSTFDSESAVILGQVDFLLQPVREYLGRPGKQLRFVDLGSKKGGFSQYILWRASRQARGGEEGARGWYFGNAGAKQDPGTDSGGGHGVEIDMRRMTLECGGSAAGLLSVFKQGTNILDPATVEAFVEFVMGGNDGTASIDLVVAEHYWNDMPDYALGLERLQYAYTIAQAVIALRVLRQGGTFVFKMAEAVTPLSAEILFLVFACFERMATVRSLASKPTSAERFIVCNHLKGDPRPIATHLLSALAKIFADQFKLSHLVSWTNVSGSKQFIGPLCHANSKLARTQVTALKTVSAAASDRKPTTRSDMEECFSPSTLQTETAERLLKSWGLPVASL